MPHAGLLGLTIAGLVLLTMGGRPRPDFGEPPQRLTPDAGVIDRIPARAEARSTGSDWSLPRRGGRLFPPPLDSSLFVDMSHPGFTGFRPIDVGRTTRRGFGESPKKFATIRAASGTYFLSCSNGMVCMTPRSAGREPSPSTSHRGERFVPFRAPERAGPAITVSAVVEGATNPGVLSTDD